MARTYRDVGIACLLAFGGLWLACSSVLQSGFARVPGGAGDVRLINYLLEHGYLWLTGHPAHAQLWNAPFFFPLSNVTAFTETFFGAAPLYWWPRSLGASPAVALDLWLIQLLLLDFLSFAYFARRTLQVSWLSASAGAYLFTYANIRLVQIGHMQLCPHFFAVIAVHGLWKMASPTQSLSRGLVWFVCGTVGEFYAGFYLGWFWALSLSIAFVVGFVLPSTRASMIAFVRRLFTPATAVAGAAALILLMPLAQHYFAAGRELGLRPFSEVAGMIPRWRSWLDFGPEHWLYGRLWVHAAALENESEHRIGLGLATMAAVGLGFWRVRHRPAFQLMAVSSLCLVLLALSVRGYTPWKAIFDFFPAAGAIRAVSRVAIHLLLPAAVGLAMATEALVISRRWILFSAVLVVVAAEQVSPRPADAWAPVVANEVLLQNKVEQAAAGASCRAFLYTPSPASCSADEPWIVRHSRAVNAHLDAMWASNRTDIPTLNGYSGTLPPRYPFWGLSYCGAEDDARIKAMIAGWCLSHGCRPSSVCWIR